MCSVPAITTSKPQQPMSNALDALKGRYFGHFKGDWHLVLPAKVVVFSHTVFVIPSFVSWGCAEVLKEQCLREAKHLREAKRFYSAVFLLFV